MTIGLLGCTILTSVFSASPLLAATHSWCTTGPALSPIEPPDLEDGAAIVAHVCSTPQFQDCCESGNRWSLKCVEAAAVYAQEQELSGGDYCGRSIWAARIPETGQYFPRDFNIVALSGYLTRTRDVEGAIAAAGGINTTSFNINYKARHDIALLAGQSIALIDGTVNGRAVYGTSVSTTRVTFPEEFLPHGGPYNIPSDFVDFAASKDMLDIMSRALARYYPATIVSLKDSGMTFVGTDPEINVFSVAASALQESRYFNFSVPYGAYVIINVNGPSPKFQWAGFGGNLAPERTLWNFPSATALTIAGVGFLGSILAPNATGTFRWGSIRGTAVVAQAEAEVEMYDGLLS